MTKITLFVKDEHVNEVVQKFMGNVCITQAVIVKDQDDSNPRWEIEWSEFHYHLFSYLMSNDCPRELAEGLDLKLFPGGPNPDKQRMDACVQAVINSDDDVHLRSKLSTLLADWSDTQELCDRIAGRK